MMSFGLISIAYAQTSVGGSSSSTAELQTIVLNIYNIAMLFGGLLAFGMIFFAAVKYTLQPGNSSAQHDARDQITQAFFGLLLLFGAYVVLNTINPEIVGFKLPPLPALPQLDQGTGNETGGDRCNASTGQCQNSASVTKLLGALPAPFKSITVTTFQGTHKANSCHFGGRTCTDGSHAIDWGINASKAVGKTLPEVLNAARAAGNSAGVSTNCRCEDAGGIFKGCTDSQANHVHCSVDNAACGCI